MGRKQRITVTVVFKRSGFADQPVNDVSVLYVVLAFASQPRYGLNAFLAIPYLQMLDINPYLYLLSNKPAVHGIHIMIDPDCAARANSNSKPLTALKTPGRQTPQYS
jgi:hypothetical protein